MFFCPTNPFWWPRLTHRLRAPARPSVRSARPCFFLVRRRTRWRTCCDSSRRRSAWTSRTPGSRGPQRSKAEPRLWRANLLPRGVRESPLKRKQGKVVGSFGLVLLLEVCASKYIESSLHKTIHMHLVGSNNNVCW